MRKLLVLGILIFTIFTWLINVNVNEPTILVDKDEDIEWLSFEKEKI